jgi:hypothetical protein
MRGNMNCHGVLASVASVVSCLFLIRKAIIRAYMGWVGRRQEGNMATGWLGDIGRFSSSCCYFC